MKPLHAPSPARKEPRSAPLDSRQIQAFAALAAAGSFTQAARDLFLTQSAISHAIKTLEEGLGCRLFERAGRRVTLTPAGGQFAPRAERILAEMAAARAELDNLSSWGRARLRVGASTSACQHILPTVLREFRQSFPDCSITIEPGDHARQIDLLEANQVDLAIMLSPEGRADLVSTPLFQDELRFVVAPAHPWVAQGRVPRDQIARQPLILYNKSSLTFRMISRYFQEEGVPLGPFIELGSMEAIKELVKIGVGVALLAPWTAREEIASGALVALPVGRRQLRRSWAVVHRKGRRLSLGEETFAGLCRSVTEDIAA